MTHDEYYKKLGIVKQAEEKKPLAQPVVKQTDPVVETTEQAEPRRGRPPKEA